MHQLRNHLDKLEQRARSHYIGQKSTLNCFDRSDFGIDGQKVNDTIKINLDQQSQSNGRNSQGRSQQAQSSVSSCRRKLGRERS